MKQLIESLDKIWCTDIKDAFRSGLIPYERQLQAFLYHKLRVTLNIDYQIWIEPVLYLNDYELDKVKPDIIITRKKTIIAIVELKFSPWSFARTLHDLDKFRKFLDVIEKEVELVLSWIPSSEIWEEQNKIEDKKLKYQFSKDTIMILCAIARPKSNGLTRSIYSDLINFRLYKGYIDEDSTIKFTIE